MTVRQIMSEYDAMLANGSAPGDIENFLTSSCASYDTEHPGDLTGRSALYNELGGFYRHNNMLDKGERAFLNARGLIEESGHTDSADYATTLNNLAGLYRMKKQFDEAIELFFAARELYSKHSEVPPQLAASRGNNLGLVYLDLGRYEDALSEFRDSLKMMEGVQGSDYEHAATYGNIYAALAGLGRRGEAVAALRLGAETAKKCDPGLYDVYSRMLGEVEE